MRAFAVRACGCNFQRFRAGAGVMRPRAFDACCRLITVGGRVSVRLASIALYYRPSGLEFFPVYLDVFNKSGVIYFCYGGSWSESDPIYWVFGRRGELHAV